MQTTVFDHSAAQDAGVIGQDIHHHHRAERGSLGAVELLHREHIEWHPGSTSAAHVDHDL